MRLIDLFDPKLDEFAERIREMQRSAGATEKIQDNPIESRPPKFDVVLREMVCDEDRIVSAKGGKLLDLVQYLQAQGQAPTVFAYVFETSHELWLMPASPFHVMVKVWLDWKDRSPLRGNLPEMYYRLNIKKRSSSLSSDERVSSPEQVERVLWEAFGWSR